MKSFARLVLAVALLAAASGCGSDGGVVGSGISAATIAGNVVEVDPAASGAAVLRLAVRLEEFAELESTTDDDGAFALSGEFAGAVTVRFETLSGRFLARLPVDVPAGSTVVLDDLEIGPQVPGGVRAREVRQRNLVGRVGAVDCALAGFLLDDDTNRPFRIRLLPTTEIRLRPGGERGGCEDIQVGDFARVEGVVSAENGGAIVAQTVGVGHGRPAATSP